MEAVGDSGQQRVIAHPPGKRTATPTAYNQGTQADRRDGEPDHGFDQGMSGVSQFEQGGGKRDTDDRGQQGCRNDGGVGRASCCQDYTV